MEKELFIFTFATGRYTIYTDLWQFVLEKSYPEYRGKVFTIKPSDPAAHGWPQYYGACVRYLYEPPLATIDQGEGVSPGFDYCYITDIDMMIMRENPTLLDFHIAEMKETGLCYSNCIRGGGEEDGANRLTGLHFVNRQWWNDTRAVRDRYLMALKRGSFGHIAIDDELMLMKIVKESGLGIVPRRTLVVRHHGIHLGTFRAKKTATIQERKRAARIRITADYARQWQEIVSTPEYVKMYEKIRTKDREAAYELYEADKFTKQRVKER